MFTSRIRKLGLILVVVSAPLVYAIAPLYLFLAEDNPAILGPFGWLPVPENAPYTEGMVKPEYRAAADEMRDLLLAHRAAIHAPALSAAVVVDGQLVWSAAVGWADLAAEKNATPDTIFRIGSTSKAVTGTLFARLVDAGLVELDTPISEYVDDLPNPAWADLTPRQLASHTAGIPSYEANGDFVGLYRSLSLRDHHEDVAEGLAYFDGSPLMFEPGTDFEYSSFGINLLSVVLQEAGGAPFQKLMQQWVTQPLGIETLVPDEPMPERATSYLLNDTVVRPWWQADLSHKLAGGGFMAKPSDLAVLGAAWLDDDFILAETRERFWTPQRLTDGTVNKQGYAISWRFSDKLWWTEKQLPNANHGGVSKGSMAWLVVIPDKKMSIALAINTRVWPFGKWPKIHEKIVAAFSKVAE